ncbi:MAG: heavy metal translocating P-type ATPase, partial [Cyanobacteria bacterium]|nr:heavy metal translocating P-type ATPase [Cyanobacteriota bacterium]
MEIVGKLFKGTIGADFLGAIELVAAVLILIMLAGGQLLESYAMRKASSVLEALSNRMPTLAHRKKGTGKNGADLEEISLDEIKLGDEILVFPHETAPVDGLVIEGQGMMDESYLTGEPYQVAKAPGSHVLSGAINGASVLTLKVEKLPMDSRFAQIMEVMQEAEQKRPQLRRLGD